MAGSEKREKGEGGRRGISHSFSMPAHPSQLALVSPYSIVQLSSEIFPSLLRPPRQPLRGDGVFPSLSASRRRR